MANSDAAALLQELGKRVAAARRARNLSQETLAEELGLSPGYLRRVEGGKENLTIGSIAKLAEALGLSPWDLLAKP